MINHGGGKESGKAVPIIDNRTRAQLIEQMRSMAPYYVPEWRFSPDDPDLGTALSLMFAHLLEGNIKRLNQVPYKSFLAFLNHFNVELAPAKPAVAQITFKLAEGTPEPVFLDSGIQLAADAPGETEPVLFETVRPILLTTAKLLDVMAVSPKQDRIVMLSEAGEPLSVDRHGKPLFGAYGQNLQEHIFYLRHDFLFLLQQPAFIELTVTHSKHEGAAAETVRQLSDREFVSWEYYSGGEWRSFDRIYGQGSVIRLIKLNQLPVEPVSCHDVYGYWIRCRTIESNAYSNVSALNKVQFDRLMLKSEYAAATELSGIKPDRLFQNDVQLDIQNSCMPFGEFFAPYGLFYISNKEALSKRGSNIQISFQAEFIPYRLYPDKPRPINWKPIMKREVVDAVDIPDPVTIASIQWEYWNGRSWSLLSTPAHARTMFHTVWEGTQRCELTFICPHDIEEIIVNAEENYWIRGRILQVENAYSPNAIYYAPQIHRMRIRYGYEQPIHAPQGLLAYNNLELKDYSVEVKTSSMPVNPFTSLEGNVPALWLGFDAPPERGPINLHMELKQRQVTEQDIPLIDWEYLRNAGGSAVWTPLGTADETNGFTRSGDITFVGPQDFAMSSSFGRTRCWIRAVNRDCRYSLEKEAPNQPSALQLALNTTLAVQQGTIVKEYPRLLEAYDTLQDQSIEYYLLSSAPVLSEKVWVDETDELLPGEIEALRRENIELDIIRDSEGEILRVWVMYSAVEQLWRSGPEDRHYRIDRATGRISFGDGIAGKGLPRSGADLVRVTYASGGGKRGNVPAGMITTLQSSIAFVEGAVNSRQAAGGCDAGTVEEAVVRGPKRFIHRNRAVTAEDFEWLTREAHPNVAKVKCLSNQNVKLEKELGAVTIVVFPKSGVGNGAHFQDLKRSVETSLLRRTAASIAFPGKLQVMEAAQLEIGVQATVWVKNMDDVVLVERELTRKLNQFLDPISGNTDGKGWEIGGHVHHSMFYALMKSVGPVVHIPQLALDVYKVESGERTEWNPDRIAMLKHSIVVPGTHRIVVELHK